MSTAGDDDVSSTVWDAANCPADSHHGFTGLADLPLRVVHCLASGLQRLHSAVAPLAKGDARGRGLRILVSNVPDATEAPVILLLPPKLRCAAHTLILEHNFLLALAVDQLARQWHVAPAAGMPACEPAGSSNSGSGSSSSSSDLAVETDGSVVASSCGRADVSILDLFASGRQLLRHPHEYNFTDIIHSCLKFLELEAQVAGSQQHQSMLEASGFKPTQSAEGAAQPLATVCDNPDGYFFYDLLHPTRRVHSLLAEEFLPLLPSEWSQETRA